MSVGNVRMYCCTSCGNRKPVEGRDSELDRTKHLGCDSEFCTGFQRFTKQGVA